MRNNGARVSKINNGTTGSKALKLVHHASLEGAQASHTFSETLEKTVDWQQMAPKRKRFVFGFLLVFVYLWLGGLVSNIRRSSPFRCDRLIRLRTSESLLIHYLEKDQEEVRIRKYNETVGRFATMKTENAHATGGTKKLTTH